MFWRRPQEAFDQDQYYDELDVGLAILEPEVTPTAGPATTEEVVRTTIEQHDSRSVGHFATVTVMTRDPQGGIHFLNGTI